MPQAIAHKAVISADVFRTHTNVDCNQSGNMRWLQSVLLLSITPLFEDITNHAVQFGDKPFPEIYNLIYGEDLSIFYERVAHVYTFGPTPHLSEDYVYEQYKDSFVFLFEGGPWLLEFLNRRGLKFCNVRMHPARFGSDLFLSFQFNDEAMNKRAREYELDPDLLAADLAYARSAHTVRPEATPEGAFVFLSQSSYDSVLIEDGRFIDLSDHKEAIERFAQGRKIYIKPHPIDTNSVVFRNFMDNFPSSEILDINTYKLLALARDCRFSTISSSSGYEAELFGHPVQFLSKNHLGNGSAFHQDYVTISHAYWTPSFWRYVLNGEGRPNLHCPFVPDRLRNSCGERWSKTF